MEQIEQRKEKAAELSSGRHANTDYAPKITPYERKKQCSLCGVVVRDSHYSFTFPRQFELPILLLYHSIVVVITSDLLFIGKVPHNQNLSVNRVYFFVFFLKVYFNRKKHGCKYAKTFCKNIPI